MTAGSPQKKVHKTHMEAQQPEENAQPTQTTQPLEVKEEPPSTYECTVCYSDGKATGKLTLGCGHDICLGCFCKLQTTPGYHGGLQAPQCPCCRRRIRTQEGATDEEKAEVKAKAQVIVNDRARATHHTERITHHQSEAQRLQGLIAERTREVEALAERVGLTDELTGHLATLVAPPRPIVRHGTVYQQPQAQPQPVAQQPQQQAIPLVQQTRCPGCRTFRTGGIAFRHIRRLDGTIARLKRCLTCQETAQQAYNTATNQANPA